MLSLVCLMLSLVPHVLGLEFSKVRETLNPKYTYIVFTIACPYALSLGLLALLARGRRRAGGRRRFWLRLQDLGQDGSLARLFPWRQLGDLFTLD